MKHTRTWALCLAGCCSTAISVFGMTGSVSASELLFRPLTGTYPYHLVGTGGTALLETVGGMKVEAASTDLLALVLSPTLVDPHIEYLKVKAEGTACHNDGKTEAVLLNLLGHFGHADPNELPAVLLLVPSGFEFECFAGLVKAKLRGGLIGAIIQPSPGEESEEATLLLEQEKGKQEYTTFLLGSEVLTSQFEEASINGAAFEQSAQEGELSLKALAGQGKFELGPLPGLRSKNAGGGVPIAGSLLCKFNAKGDVCKIIFENLLMVEQKILKVEILGANGTTRFTKKTEGCVVGNTLSEKGAAGSTCTDEVELKINQAGKSLNDYCMTAHNVTTKVGSFACSLLKIN